MEICALINFNLIGKQFGMVNKRLLVAIKEKKNFARHSYRSPQKYQDFEAHCYIEALTIVTYVIPYRGQSH